MDYERYNQFAYDRLYREAERLPRWARIENLYNIVPVRELRRFLIKK